MGFSVYKTDDISNFCEMVRDYKKLKLRINNDLYECNKLVVNVDKQLIFVKQNRRCSECFPFSSITSLFFEDEKRRLLFYFQRRKRPFTKKEIELSNILLSNLGGWVWCRMFVTISS